MAKRNVSYRVSDETYNQLGYMARKTGYTQTQLVEMGVQALVNLGLCRRISEHEDNLGLDFGARRLELVDAATINLDARHYAFKAIDARVEDWLLTKEWAALES